MANSNRKLIDLTGQVFNELAVLREGARKGKSQRRAWECLCSCGQFTSVETVALRSGEVKSCGCLRHKPYARKHGMTGTPTYNTWINIRNRCYDPENKKFADYGGRGITVCERWLHSFENFLADMGERPPNKETIERRNYDLGYSPDNCYWATWEEQQNNRRSNRLLTLRERTQTVAQWARELGLKSQTIISRLDRSNMSTEEALSPRRYKPGPHSS
jgi:hypothetical protein